MAERAFWITRWTWVSRCYDVESARLDGDACDELRVFGFGEAFFEDLVDQPLEVRTDFEALGFFRAVVVHLQHAVALDGSCDDLVDEEVAGAYVEVSASLQRVVECVFVLFFVVEDLLSGAYLGEHEADELLDGSFCGGLELDAA